jgi:hypothetical protein
MHRCLFVSKIEALRVCLEGEVSPWLAKPSTISIRLVHHRNGTQCIDSLDTKHTIKNRTLRGSDSTLDNEGYVQDNSVAYLFLCYILMVRFISKL